MYNLVKCDRERIEGEGWMDSILIVNSTGVVCGAANLVWLWGDPEKPAISDATVSLEVEVDGHNGWRRVWDVNPSFLLKFRAFQTKLPHIDVVTWMAENRRLLAEIEARSEV